MREATTKSLNATVGVVTQDPHLFHYTLRVNLVFAKPDATDAELEQALRAAQIWHLIETLPLGLETVVGERGYRLSGGEKQRVALARLLLKSPRLVVLDEATAHLDAESEAAVQRALEETMSSRTSLVIAHRLSTIRNADQYPRGGRRSHRPTRHTPRVTRGRWSLPRPRPDPIRQAGALNRSAHGCAPPSTWITDAVVARSNGDSRATAVSATAEESFTSQPSGARSVQGSSNS